MAIPSSGPISFEDLNDEIGNGTQDTLDLIQAGLDFGFSPGAPGLGGNWTDANAGLSVSEFYGQTAGGVALNGDYYSVGSGYSLTPTSTTPIAPGDTTEQFLLSQVGTPASTLTANSHNVPVSVLADGTYVIYNGQLTNGGSMSPGEGVSGSISQLNPHTLSIPSVPATLETISDLPAPAQPTATPTGFFRSFHHIQDRLATPTQPAFVLDTMNVYSQYNNKTLTDNPTPVPYNAGTYLASTIDWKFNTLFSLTTSGGNPSPNTDTSIVTAQTVGSVGIQPVVSNFLRTEVDVTVNYNNSPSPRQTWIHAFVPTSAPNGGAFSWGEEMNTGGNPSNPTGYYYAIPVIQDGSPAASNTLTTSPTSINFDFNGGTSSPISIDVTPNSNSYTYSLTGPGAPAFTLNSLSSPQTGDDTFSITASPNSGGTRTADLQFTHPGGVTPLPITQTGITVRIDGYDANNTTTSKTIPFSLTSDTLPVTTTPTSITWQASVLPSPTPFVSLPSPLSRTGPAPTFQATWPVNPSPSPRSQTIEVDFNVNGTPYYKRFTYNQSGAPAPEVSVSPTFSYSVPYTGGNRTYTVTANTPFSVSYTPSPKITWQYGGSPLSSPTPFSAGPTPAPYTFTATAAPNPIYETYTSTFQVSSPILPSPTTRNVTLNGNPFDVRIAFNPTSPLSAAFGGSWSYSPSGLSVTGNGPVSVTANIQAFRFSDGSPINAPWTVNVVSPNPAVPTGPVVPFSVSDNGSGTEAANLSIPSNPSSTFQRSFTVSISSPFGPGSIASSPVPGIQAAYAVIPDAFNLPTTPATIPHTGGSSPSRSLTTTPASLPWGPITSPAPWVSVSVGPTGSGPATVSFSAPSSPGTYRSTTVTFNNPVSPVVVPVAQPAPPVPDTLTISPTNITLPYSVGFPETITATGAGIFNKINNNPSWIQVSPSGPASAPAPFTINALSANPSPSPRVGDVDISHPTNNYTITVTQEGAPTPTPTPTPSPCEGISVRVSSLGSTSVCSQTRYNTHYFDASFINSANEYYGTSTDCSTLRSGEWYVADSGGTWARFFNGIFQEAGVCSGGGGFG